MTHMKVYHFPINKGQVQVFNNTHPHQGHSYATTQNNFVPENKCPVTKMVCVPLRIQPAGLPGRVEKDTDERTTD